jgi:hypothetical protein
MGDRGKMLWAAPMVPMQRLASKKEAKTQRREAATSSA